LSLERAARRRHAVPKIARLRQTARPERKRQGKSREQAMPFESSKRAMIAGMALAVRRLHLPTSAPAAGGSRASSRMTHFR
jgi:hypothetical protein